MKESRNKNILIFLIVLIVIALLVVVIRNTSNDNNDNNVNDNNTNNENSNDNDISNECSHKFDETIIASTCEVKGYTQYKCQKCEYSYNDNYTELSDHNFINGICSFCSEYDALKFLAYELDSQTNTYIVTSAYSGIIKTTIPSLYNGLPVSEINSGVFKGNNSLEKIVISENVKRIHSETFMFCTKLTDVVFLNNSKLEYIDHWSFAYSSQLRNIEIPQSVIQIGGSAFYECTSLTSITIPNSVTTIESQTFVGCRNLKEVKFNIGLKVIEEVAFSGCALTEINFPDTLEKIERQAFNNNKNLTKVMLPKSIMDIHDEVFLNCKSLTNIFYKGAKEDWKNINLPSVFTIAWATYSEPEKYAYVYYYKEDFPTDNSRYWYYDENNDIIIW